MLRWRMSLVSLLLLTSFRVAFACSCSNSTPIQQSSARYKDRAVFTAHVVQLMGRVYTLHGKRQSGQVLAVVKDRYWGLPWYWPKVVVLDGGFFCNIVLEEGVDYLVSGRRDRYGVLDVSGCSRTQPLSAAQLDMRTLDGSHCASPGGTIIGDVNRGQDDFRVNPIAPDVSVTFQDQNGKSYSVRSDKDGIYELQHLPAGTYILDSYLDRSRSLWMRRGVITVADGVCGEASVLVKNYDISGRLPLGLATAVVLYAADSDEYWGPVDFQADGRFYLRDIPDGEYLLAFEPSLGQVNDFYYPGTFDKHKATRIKISNRTMAGASELDFKPDLLPFVPIRIALDPLSDSGKFSWRIQLTAPENNILRDEPWSPGTKSVVLYGLRGQTYGVRLYGDANSRETAQGWCGSAKDLPITVQPGMPLVRLAVPEECR